MGCLRLAHYHGKTNVVSSQDYYPFGLAFNERRRTASAPQNFLYNGKELQAETGVYDYGQRMCDGELGRFWQVDRFADKYFNLSSYQYGANNPVKYIDVNGDSIWINYGEGQRVFYNEGSFYNENGSAYEGDNGFVSVVGNVLNEMNGTENGQKVLSVLSSSGNSFSFSNSVSSGGNTSLSFSFGKNGGGTINASALVNSDISKGQKLESVAHELFHGYQYEKGQGNASVNGINNEIGAYLFGRGISISAGYPAVSSFGTNTSAGQVYGGAMSNLLWGYTINQRDYQNAINNFKQGSVVNALSNGIYNKFGVNNNISNPVIKQFMPLIKK